MKTAASTQLSTGTSTQLSTGILTMGSAAIGMAWEWLQE